MKKLTIKKRIITKINNSKVQVPKAVYPFCFYFNIFIFIFFFRKKKR